MYSKIINLEAMTWPRYIENRTIVRRVIMRLNCICNTSLLKTPKSNFLPTHEVEIRP